MSTTLWIIVAGAVLEPNVTVPSMPRWCQASSAGRAAAMTCRSTESVGSRAGSSAPAAPPITMMEFIR